MIFCDSVSGWICISVSDTDSVSYRHSNSNCMVSHTDSDLFSDYLYDNSTDLYSNSDSGYDSLFCSDS